MRYDDLSEKAKAKARDWYRESNAGDDWGEHVYTDAVTIGALMGIEIGTRTVKLVSEKSYETIDINFDLGRSEYCSFGGRLSTLDLRGCIEKVTTYASTDEDLHEIASQGEDIYNRLLAHAVANRLDEENAEYVDCEPGIPVTIDNRRERAQLDDGGYLTPRIYDMASKFIRDFSSWILKQLRAFDEEMSSDEYVKDQLGQHDYNFDEDGNPD